MEINLETRSEVLRYSLIIENSINELLMASLGIYSDGKETKLFGNKGRISFKNKIDLLYDIAVFTRDENNEMELLMIFRNKFLHDISSDSFLAVISQLDNGIKNRFKDYFDSGGLIQNESDCSNAYKQLFKKNLDTILNKIDVVKQKIEDRNRFFQIQNKQIINYIDTIYPLIDDIYAILENGNTNQTLDHFRSTIHLKLDASMQTLNSNFEKAKIELDEFFGSEQRMKNIFGVTKIEKDTLPKWEDFNTK